MKKNRFVLLVIIFCTSLFNIYLKGYSQFSFNYSYKTLSDEYAMDAIETNDGGFIIMGRQGDLATSLNNTILIKLNAYGDTVKTKLIQTNSESCVISSLIKSDDQNFFGIGIKSDSQLYRLWLLKFNQNLDILFDSTYYIGNVLIEYFWGFVNNSGKIVLYGNTHTSSTAIHPYIVPNLVEI